MGVNTFRLLVLGSVAPLVLGTAAIAQTAPAQTVVPQPPVQQSPIVQRIDVVGNQRIESGTIRSYLPISPGQPISQLTIDTSLKSLFATGLFADAEITFDQGIMRVAVQENPIVNRVIFEGNRTKEDKFTEEMQLAPRAIYTKAKVQADAQRIADILRAQGRFAASVTPKFVELPQNRIDVIFEIDEGPKTGVASINFIGNEAFTDAELRKAVLTAESQWWNFLESNDNFDPDRLEYDRQLLREFYTKQGYADFSVVSAIAELTPDREDFYITFTLEEGPKYEFGKVDVRTTLEKLSGDNLERIVPIREGMGFNSELIEQAEESITYATGIAGYAFVDVSPRVTRNPETQTADIVFEVNEGPRVYVERINIRGNQQTLDRVIRREMRLSEGDAFNRILVERSERRVKGLGYFSEVEVTEQPGTAPDRTVLDVAVTEQSTGSFQVGAGLSSADAFIVNFQLEQRNLLGKGQYLLLDLQASSRTRRARLSFTEPYFLGRRLRSGFTLFADRTDFEEAGYVSDSFGAGVNVGFPVSEFGSLGLNYLIRHDDITLEINGQQQLGTGESASDILLPGVTDFTENNGIVTANRCDFIESSIDPTCESRGTFLTSQIGYTLRFDQRNDPINPSAGWRVDLGQSLAGLGGDVNFLKSTARASIYQRLPYDFIGSLKFDLGYVDGFGDDGVRVNDRFFKGGNRGFRGFDVAGVGPRYIRCNASTLNSATNPITGEIQPACPLGAQTFDRAIGGRAYAIGTIEAQIPLPLPPEQGIRAALFTDFGSVGIVDEDDKLLNNSVRNYIDFNLDGIYDEPVQDDFSLRVTAGVSINWNSPFGPVQIDIAEALVREDYDNEQVFRFSAGGAF